MRTSPKTRNIALPVINACVAAAVQFAIYKYLYVALGSAEVGIWSIATALSFITATGDFGIASGVSRAVARHRLSISDCSSAAIYVETAAVSAVGLTGTVAALSYLLLSSCAHLILPNAALPAVLVLLPYTILNFQLTAIAAIYLSALDGLEKNHLRSLISIGGSCILAVSAFHLVKKYGLTGLSISQLIQTSCTLLAAVVYTRRQLKIQIIKPRWRLAFAKEAFSYGSKLQASSFAAYLFEPLTKILLAKYGTLECLGQFEGANRVVTTIRSFILAGVQPTIPVYARLEIQDPSAAILLYVKTCRLLSLVSIPVYLGVVASTPLLSTFLWGTFAIWHYALIGSVSVSWLVNTLSAGAYFANQGSGEVSRNLKSHLITGGLNLMLGSCFGILYGSTGVITAWMCSLIAGSLYTILTYRQNPFRGGRNPVPSRAIPLIAISLILLAITVGIQIILTARNMGSIIVIASSAAYALFVAAVFSREVFVEIANA